MSAVQNDHLLYFRLLDPRMVDGSITFTKYVSEWATDLRAISLKCDPYQIIAIPYSQLDMEVDEAVECFPIQQLRASMRARRSSIGSSEGSSINDSAIRVDVSFYHLPFFAVIYVLSQFSWALQAVHAERETGCNPRNRCKM